MTHSLVIIAGPKEPLTPALLDKIIGVIPTVYRTPPQWLAENQAAEIAIQLTNEAHETATHGTQADCLKQIHDEVIAPARAQGPVDIALVPQQGRHKKLLVADMESTIIQEELIDELARQTNRGDEIAEITAQAMRGELDFAEALKARVTKFAGLDAALLDTLYQTSVSLMPGAATLVRTMTALGATTALVSGGFTIFTSRVAARLGFDHHRGNTLEIRDGVITGDVVAPILDRSSKEHALVQIASDHDIAIENTLAVGDGANDLDMIRRAGLGVAFRAKPVVAEQADVSIQHADLTALLYLQGIPRSAFVEA